MARRSTSKAASIFRCPRQMMSSEPKIRHGAASGGKRSGRSLAPPKSGEETMPVYDYQCTRCGPFTDMRPMAEADRSHQCPTCGADAPRAYLTAPYLAAMSRERRLAHAANERSA